MAETDRREPCEECGCERDWRDPDPDLCILCWWRLLVPGLMAAVNLD